MAKFLIDLKLDGYKSEESMIEACQTFILDQLDFSGSNIKILRAFQEYEDANLITDNIVGKIL